MRLHPECEKRSNLRRTREEYLVMDLMDSDWHLLKVQVCDYVENLSTN